MKRLFAVGHPYVSICYMFLRLLTCYYVCVFDGPACAGADSAQFFYLFLLFTYLLLCFFFDGPACAGADSARFLRQRSSGCTAVCLPLSSVVKRERIL